MPEKNENEMAVIWYLVGRGLDYDIIKECIDILTPIWRNGCMLFDWTDGIKEVICNITLNRGYTCHLSEHNKNFSISFYNGSGEKIGFAPLRDDLSGIREDIDYGFLNVGSLGNFRRIGVDLEGSMQDIQLKSAETCDSFATKMRLF